MTTALMTRDHRLLGEMETGPKLDLGDFARTAAAAVAPPK